MTELKRWLEDGAPPEVGRLLSAARAETPRRCSLERTLLSLGVTGLATTAGAKTVAGAVAVTLKWVAVGALGGSVVMGTMAGIRQLAAPAPAPSISAPSVSRPARSPRPAEPRHDVPVPFEPEASPEPRAKSTAVLPLASREPGPGPAVDRYLTEEIGVIDRARASLNAGDPSEALRALDEHDRRFDDPRLAPEALYLRMEARARLWDRAGAERAAREILKQYPGGPQVGRAEELLRSEPALKKP
jgi:hypothetical protein